MQIKVYQVYLYSRCSLMHLHSHARRHSCKQESLYTHLGRRNETEGVRGERLRQRQAERDERLYPPVSSMRQLYVTEHEMKVGCIGTNFRPSQPDGPYHQAAPHLQSDFFQKKMITPSPMQRDLQDEIGRNNPV